MNAPTIEATAVITFLFVISLLGSYVVLKVLKGTALIKRKGIQLGGAAGMFVVMFVLLNKYLPEIRQGLIEEASAMAQPIKATTDEGLQEIASVYLSPATQLTTLHDLRRLDKNKYVVHETVGIAIPKSPNIKDWEIGKFEDLPLVGIMDIPALGMGLEILHIMLNHRSPLILGIQARDSDLVVISRDSSIAGIPADLNYFNDDDYVRATIEAMGMVQRDLVGEQVEPDIPDEIFQAVQKQSSAQLETTIDQKLPTEKNIRNGVFVMPLTKDLLNMNVVSEFATFSLLDKSLIFLNMSGQFAGGSFSNMFMDQKRGIVSFNASTTLDNVEVNGVNSSLLVNNVGFIVAGEEKAFLVLLAYISTSDIQVFKELERIFNGLRFVG